MAYPKNTPDNFWRKVDKNGPTPPHMPHLGSCWVWTGCADQRLYGLFKIGGRMHRAHRFAWTMARGVIPDGLYVCHKCDNPSCVRLDHLFTGTGGDNVADKMSKGRHRVAAADGHGWRTHPESIPRGEKHGGAKLTTSAVLEIRRLAAGGERHRRLSEVFGVTIKSVGAIVQRRTWKHLP